MKNKVLILAHERSVNKGEFLINYLFDKVDLFLVTEYEVPAFKKFAHKANRIIAEEFDVKDIVRQLPQIDQIFTLSENLLPLQAELEEFYGITNIAWNCANILANKQLFQNFCKELGFQNISPLTVTPLTEADLEAFKVPFIVKPDIGTGENRFLPPSFADLEYSSWSSGDIFLRDLREKGTLQDFLALNRQGIKKPRFNNKICRMMIQEFKPSLAPSLSPCGFVKNGQLNISFFVNNVKLNHLPQFPALGDSKIQYPENSTSGDFAVFSRHVQDIPKRTRTEIEIFLTNIFEKLEIKNLFFSGPDFHFTESGMMAIDFNPRPGHFFNLMDAVNDQKLAKTFFESADMAELRPLLWSTIPVSSLTLHRVDWEEKIRDRLCLETLALAKGSQLPARAYLQSRPTSLQVCISGRDQNEMFAEYREVKMAIQTVLDGNL